MYKFAFGNSSWPVASAEGVSERTAGGTRLQGVEDSIDFRTTSVHEVYRVKRCTGRIKTALLKLLCSCKRRNAKSSWIALEILESGVF